MSFLTNASTRLWRDIEMKIEWEKLRSDVYGFFKKILPQTVVDFLNEVKRRIRDKAKILELREYIKKIGLVPSSKIVYKKLKRLRGVEIGAATHNDFGLNCLNVDVIDTNDSGNKYVNEQLKLCERIKKVDVVASGDNLPFEDNKWDYVFSSHVLEHFYDPIKALKEWNRVVKPGGLIVMIVPHKERTFDKDRERTTLGELIERHKWMLENPEAKFEDAHHSVWITEDVLELCKYLDLNVIEYYDEDDGIGNGFLIIIQKGAA